MTSAAFALALMCLAGKPPAKNACVSPELCAQDSVTLGKATFVGGFQRCQGGAGPQVAFLVAAKDGARFTPVASSVVPGGDITLVFSPREGLVLAFGGRNNGDDLPFAMRSEDGGRTFSRSRLPFRGVPRAARVHGDLLEVLLVQTSAEGDQRTWALGSDDLGMTWTTGKQSSVEADWTQDAAVVWSHRLRPSSPCEAAPHVSIGGKRAELSGPLKPATAP